MGYYHEINKAVAVAEDFMKLEWKKFEYSKTQEEKMDKLNERSVKAQEEIGNSMKVFTETAQNLNKTMEVILENQNVLYQKMIELESKIDSNRE